MVNIKYLLINTLQKVEFLNIKQKSIRFFKKEGDSRITFFNICIENLMYLLNNKTLRRFSIFVTYIKDVNTSF